MSKKKMIGAVVGVLVMGTAVAMFRTPSVPDAETQTPEEVAKTIASSKFKKLPEEQQQAYAQKAFEARRAPRAEGEAHPMDALSEKERQAFRENARPLMRQQMQQRMTEYFELPPGERVARLDEMIDEMEKRRAEGGGRGGPFGGGPPGGGGPPPSDGGPDGAPEGERRGPTPERMKERIESSSPQERAQFLEFMKDMRDRREQRGLDSPR